MQVQQFVLEYATPRAGDIAVVGEALGCAGNRPGRGQPAHREAVEGVAAIVAQVERALEFFAPERIFLNPDCGFGCFANRCVNDETTAAAKLAAIAAAARVLRERY